MYVTIDPYHTIEEYNIAKQALSNNNIDYIEYIHTKPPFNWYVDLPSAPIMTNYDELPDSQQKFLVNKVLPALPNQAYLLQRRNNDTGKKALKKFVLNEPLLQADNSNYACFINVRSRDHLKELSKEFPAKIWYMGKYYSNKFKVALCTNKMVNNFIDPQDILVEINGSGNAIELELELNFKVFKLKDRLKKYTETPYFEGGKYNPVKIQQFQGL